MEFHRPVVEEAEHVARVYRDRDERSVGPVQTEGGGGPTLSVVAPAVPSSSSPRPLSSSPRRARSHP
eukprot:2520256-Lingulodinium_polyedra.AAC.1